MCLSGDVVHTILLSTSDEATTCNFALDVGHNDINSLQL